MIIFSLVTPHVNVCVCARIRYADCTFDHGWHINYREIRRGVCWPQWPVKKIYSSTVGTSVTARTTVLPRCPLSVPFPTPPAGWRVPIGRWPAATGTARRGNGWKDCRRINELIWAASPQSRCLAWLKLFVRLIKKILSSDRWSRVLLPALIKSRNSKPEYIFKQLICAVVSGEFCWCWVD